MNTKLQLLIVTICSFFLSHSIYSAEQDNWYLAKSWDLSEVMSVYVDMNQSGEGNLIFAARGSIWDNNGRDIQVFDFNGTLLNTFGKGSFMDITMDANGTIYVAAQNSVRSFSKSSGRVVSVTVDHPGSKYYKHWSDTDYYITFTDENGSGATAYAVMEQNASDTSSYNKYVASIIVTEGGLYQSEPNATVRSKIDSNNGGSDANLTAVLGLAWGQDWSTGGFNKAQAIAISPTSSDLFVADAQTHKIIVLDRNGTIKREFGSNGTAPGQFYFEYGSHHCDLAFLSDGTLVIADRSYLHFYHEDGTFLSRTNNARYNVSVAPDDTLYSDHRIRKKDGTSLKYASHFWHRSKIAFNAAGDAFEPYENNQIRIWKRVYRTKGLPTPNAVPHPAIRGISQRAGTNIIDLDFEIIDVDDANATVGILAAVNGQFDNPSNWILPTTWVDGTEAKIGSPIPTNTIHRVSWNVKGDWLEQTGSLNFEVLAQDARRSQPVDLHFLELPLTDGTLTISRSPVKDSGMITFFKHQLTMGLSGLNLINAAIVDENGIELVSSNLQVTKTGRDYFIETTGHRWAKMVETSLAREAATPGGVNQWTATNQVKPRNLPNQVNEYGFDVGNHGNRAWWVVKSSTLPFPEFNATIFDNNSSQDQNFGNRVAAYDNLVAVAPRNSEQTVYIYEYSEINGSLNPKFEVRPGDLNQGSHYSGGFSEAMAFDNGHLAVGAHDAYINNRWGAGAVYLFDINGSVPYQLSKISASDGTDYDNFGRSVDLRGNLIVVGAPNDDAEGYNESGSAYLFRKESNGTITEIAKLTLPEPNSNDYFGAAVAAGDNMVAIGAYEADYTLNGQHYNAAGKVFLYKIDGNTVSLVQTLKAPTPHTSSHYFGYSLSISGNRLVVGEYGRYNQIYGHNTGAVYLYEIENEGTAQLKATVHSAVPRSYGRFGKTVNLSGNRLVVGAEREDSENDNHTGAAYLYSISEDSKATLLERFSHPDGRNDDYFGSSVGVAGQNAIVGARQFDLPGNRWNAGSAIFFRASE